MDSLLYQNHDKDYITSYSRKLSTKILAANKFNSFLLGDKNTGERIRYRPDLGVSFGIGIAYKWLALDVTTSLGFHEENISDSKYRDFQARFFTSKQYLRFRYQYYLGYKYDDLSSLDLAINTDNIIRTDLRTIQFGLQYLYAFNYGRFSLKAPFVMNELQRKSAGSVVAGGAFQMYILDADSSIIPTAAQGLFDSNSQLTELNVASFAISIGYMYTFSIREHFFITLGLIPGIGYKSGDLKVKQLTPIESNLLLRAKLMNAIGYNSRRFYTGVQFFSNHNYMPINKTFNFRTMEGRITLFVGYRFK
jgi:hypothetical protein